MRSEHHTRGFIAGLAAASIWGGMYVVSKVVLDIIPPFTLLSIRLLLAVLVLGWVVARRGGLHLSRFQVRQLLGVGLMGYGVSLGLQFVGTHLSTAANGAVITSATPAFVFLFAAVLLGERISRQRAAALLVATSGVLLVIDVRSAQLAPDLFRGNLALAGAGLTWALYSVLVRVMTRKVDALPVSFVAFFGGLLISLPAAAIELRSTTMGIWTPGIFAGVLYLGIISTALAAYLWNKAFEWLEAGLASLTFFAQPVVGTLLGVLFLGERLAPVFLLGGGLIGLGLWLASRDATPRAELRSEL